MKKTLRRVKSSKCLKRSLRWKESVMNRSRIMKRCIKMKLNTEAKEKRLFSSSDHKTISMTCS
jgi:hypothetical protein